MQRYYVPPPPSWHESENSSSNKLYIINLSAEREPTESESGVWSKFSDFLIHCKGYIGIWIYLHKFFCVVIV